MLQLKDEVSELRSNEVRVRVRLRVRFRVGITVRANIYTRKMFFSLETN